MAQLMRLEEFRARVKAAFGENLENATPANVRDFLDQLSRESYQAERALRGSIDLPYEIPSTSGGSLSWETLVREFFLQVLTLDQEQGFMLLWVFALDLAYSGIEDLHAEELNNLFRDLPE